jgi:fumarylacetoacetase
MELGQEFWHEARVTIQALFDVPSTKISEDLKKVALIPHDKAQMIMPVFIRDYTDFYSSKNHAYNVGVMFRGPDNAL